MAQGSHVSSLAQFPSGRSINQWEITDCVSSAFALSIDASALRHKINLFSLTDRRSVLAGLEMLYLEDDELRGWSVTMKLLTHCNWEFYSVKK